MILAIDPGPKVSGIVITDGRTIHQAVVELNQTILTSLRQPMQGVSELVIEQIESFGMPVGWEIFETVFWSGRFIEAWERHGRAWTRLSRRVVKGYLCHSSRATDSTVRQAILDRFGGRSGAIGVKAHPGPLYGIRRDAWQALALALTHLEADPKEFSKPSKTVSTSLWRTSMTRGS